MKKVRNLLDTSRYVENHPELYEMLHGPAATYGELIYSRRLALNLTQSELAEKAKVDLKTITTAEGGTEELGIHTYKKIFDVLLGKTVLGPE
ncbi:helix-turn-helix domain-containing protein [Peribacillus loiseleuriae]|uniref:helix-turn-helix domain-containing protein n=1 Tax=Peribacillus loiseleuriae TaxID=1679170 RepID=UPI003829AE6E